MAGPSYGDATQIESGKGMSSTCSCNTPLSTGQCYGVWVLINTDLSGTVTSGVEVKVNLKSSSGGTECQATAGSVLCIRLDNTADGTAFMLSPGHYELNFKMTDAAGSSATMDVWKYTLT